MTTSDVLTLNGSPEEIAKVKEIYAKHDEMPYISPQRDLTEWLNQVELSSGKTVPQRNMIRLEEDLLPGHIIILWRVRFGTYDNTTVISKYFEYDYGIDAKADIELLIDRGLVDVMSAKESLVYLTAPQLKQWLKEKNVAGIAKMKKADLMDAIREAYTEDELAEKFTLRGYKLTAAGEKVLDNHDEVIDKHPKKKY